jgi:23S rRNA (cytosine1962-C5)-methyltransferase
MIKLLTPSNWVDYELIDTGRFRKLERFGPYILSRPEPQAIWDPSLDTTKWDEMAHATYTRRKGDTRDLVDDERGEWKRKPGMPEQWKISYSYEGMRLTFRLGLTAFKHVGIFPEQAVNWEYLYNKVKGIGRNDVKVLNLFAYTGGASLAACAGGARVTHLDSVKQVVGWAKENMEISGMNDIRWIIDDAVKFVKRELRRESKYDGIILDPPAYGRGPEGEKWVLQSGINELLKDCASLLYDSSSFLLMNMYSVGFSPIIAESLINTVFQIKGGEMQELYLEDRAKRKIPMGVVYLLNA